MRRILQHKNPESKTSLTGSKRVVMITEEIAAKMDTNTWSGLEGRARFRQQQELRRSLHLL
ncbi:hypothetical protein CP10881SC42_0008 [Chlamydia avium]|uniref:Uncharacterized protein n=1 Tax=Chlamydia avium TaxID=1457141 RepID=A0ABP2X7Q4_9CHLA|nr:hypothetical protein CP10743SC13_0912 [Chlamydia psittaci 10_743_SC13]EPP38707.1 hypothetical protein CP10881SC42_0008 [Chlamydia avium]